MLILAVQYVKNYIYRYQIMANEKHWNSLSSFSGKLSAMQQSIHKDYSPTNIHQCLQPVTLGSSFAKCNADLTPWWVIIVFCSSRQCTAEHLFAPDSTLWEHGCLGGPRSHPEPVLLYYNYRTLFKDCPILMCDYYINIIPRTNRDKLQTKRAQRPVIDRQQSKSNTSKTASERRDS